MSLTEGEKLQAQRMYAQHEGFQAIARRLGKRVQDVHRCITKNMRREIPSRRQLREDLAAAKVGLVAAGLLHGRAKAPEDALEDRDRRLSSEYRDFTSEYFGDPRPGYSALDKKNACIKV